MHPAAVILIAIGAFYMFAGIVATRAALVSLFLDRALTAISGNKPSTRETALSAWLLASANLVLAGGAALMLRLDLAVWLFAAGLATQAAYLLVLAPLYFDVDDPPDAAGRRRTINAAVIYAAATALVAWAAFSGHLMDWRIVPVPAIVAATAAVVAHAGYTLWRSATPIARAADPAPDLEHRPDPALSKSIAVMAAAYRLPVWSMDDIHDSDFPPEALNLSPALCRELTDWAEAYLGSIDPEDAEKSAWSDETLQRHEAEGRRLAVRIARERPDLAVHVFSVAKGFEKVDVDAPNSDDKPL